MSLGMTSLEPVSTAPVNSRLRRIVTPIPAVELANAIAQEAVRRGVLMFTTGRGYLKFTPPLCIETDAALEAADVIRQCLLDTLDSSR